MLYIILHTYDKDPETLLWSGVSYLWARQVSQILLCTDKSQGLCSKSQIPRSLRFEVRRVHGQHRLEGDNARNTTLSLSLSLSSLFLSINMPPKKHYSAETSNLTGLLCFPKRGKWTTLLNSHMQGIPVLFWRELVRSTLHQERFWGHFYQVSTCTRQWADESEAESGWSLPFQSAVCLGHSASSNDKAAHSHMLWFC